MNKQDNRQYAPWSEDNDEGHVMTDEESKKAAKAAHELMNKREAAARKRPQPRK